MLLELRLFSDLTWLNKFVPYRRQNWKCLKLSGLTYWDRKDPKNSIVKNLLYTEVAFKALQWKEVSQSNSASPFFSKQPDKIKVMLYRICLCLSDWSHLDLLLRMGLTCWFLKMRIKDGSSRIFISVGDFHS